MKIGLFIPCYVDAVYPQVGVATYKLLKHLGLDVTYPLNQTCCGQPMANAGFEKMAVPLMSNNVIACTIPAIGVRPPFLMLVAVRAMAPVAGMPPNSGVTMLAMPCPISSVLLR